MKKTPDKQAFPPPPRRGRPARRRLTNRELAEKYRPRFTCAGCGRTFRIPDFKAEMRDMRHYVVLGGRKYCSKCAAARQPRRASPEAWAQSENYLPLPQKGGRR